MISRNALSSACISSPVTKQTLHFGMAFSATAALERGDLGRMLLGKLRPDHHTALHQAARLKDLVPLGGEVQRGDEIRVLAAGHGDHGFGEDGKADFPGGDGRVQLCRLGVAGVNVELDAAFALPTSTEPSVTR